QRDQRRKLDVDMENLHGNVLKVYGSCVQPYDGDHRDTGNKVKFPQGRGIPRSFRQPSYLRKDTPTSTPPHTDEDRDLIDQSVPDVAWMQSQEEHFSQNDSYEKS